MERYAGLNERQIRFSMKKEDLIKWFKEKKAPMPKGSGKKGRVLVRDLVEARKNFLAKGGEEEESEKKGAEEAPEEKAETPEEKFWKDVKGLKRLHGQSPLMTNAHLNRNTAQKVADAAFKVGLSQEEVISELVRAFSKVFYKDPKGGIGQKYDSYYTITDDKGAFALKETKYTILSKSADALIKRIKAKAKDKTKAKRKTKEEAPKKEISRTISKQIGNQAFFMMGAKNLINHGDALSFRIGRNPKGVNYVKITLDKGRDLYNIEFGRIHGTTYKVKSSMEGVDVDSLHGVIEEGTSMALSLNPRPR